MERRHNRYGRRYVDHANDTSDVILINRRRLRSLFQLYEYSRALTESSSFAYEVVEMEAFRDCLKS